MAAAAAAGPQRAVSPASCALVIVDLQRDFCHPDGLIGRRLDAAAVDGMCVAIDRLYAAARRSDVPVVFIHTIHRHATDSVAWRSRRPADELTVCREGSWGAEAHHRVPAADDIVVQKHRYSGFHGTELEHVLHTLCRSTLVLVGTATNVSIESTARDACMLDYDVIVVDDASWARTSAEHVSALSNVRKYFGHVAETSAVVAGWDGPAKPIPDLRWPLGRSVPPGWQNPFHRERR